MAVRVRFAPSPTGHVHIGNIRAAIFNWLFARHEAGEFLLRIEDTDRERSTSEAIDTLLDAMAWLDLNCDADPLYQTSQRPNHLAAAERLQAAGHAYRSAKGGASEAILFRIPWDCDDIPEVRTVGSATLDIHRETPVTVDATGVTFAQVSKKGKAMPAAACLAGFRDLQIVDEQGNVRFALNDVIDQILAQDASFSVDGGTTLRFTRREVVFQDLVKGELSKPLDSMKDLVIVRGDESPVFHLANVADDITQQITHVIRGDDHVDNTYRHLFLFRALGATPPTYAHLPMIVNAAGKPYSKRDGDAFVGDFQAQGFLPEALFNYLTLLGWSPGDDREKMSRQELVAAFTLDRVQHAAAQMDIAKLTDLNGQYMAALPFERFLTGCLEAAEALPWGATADPDRFAAVARLMQSRTKRFMQVEQWQYFFCEAIEYEEKGCRKFLQKPGIKDALARFEQELDGQPFTPEAIEAATHRTTEALEIPNGKLNQPLRLAITGSSIGAGIYETIEILGRECVLKRLGYTRASLCDTPQP